MTPADREAVLDALRQGPGTPEQIAARLSWPVHLTYCHLRSLTHDGSVQRRDIYSIDATTAERGTTP